MSRVTPWAEVSDVPVTARRDRRTLVSGFMGEKCNLAALVAVLLLW
jgi:hypothetical protein